MTAALGRLLSAGAMMGSMMKGEDDKLTLQMKGDGPIAQMTVTADSHGNVKGFAANPAVDIPLKRAGKLDVGGAVGKGFLWLTTLLFPSRLRPWWDWGSWSIPTVP